MLVQPIVERELRVQSRAAGTFWLRVFAGLAAVGTLAAAFRLENELAMAGPRGRGPWLFALLHSCISVFFAATCPLMSCDTLAQERREGTLGILLLTPLDPRHVVLGKMVVHLIRAFTIWLAILPVLAIPMLLGGVSGLDLCFALGLELGIVLGSLAAGLIASSLCSNAGKAMGLAAVLTLVFGEALALVSFFGLLPSLLANPNSEFSKHMWLTATFGPWFLGTGLLENGFSGFMGRNPPWMRLGLTHSLIAVMLASFGLACAAVLWASRKISNSNLVRQPTASQEARLRFWFQPRLSGRHRLRRSALLVRDPMMWLYTIRPTAALVRWGWCAAVLLAWTIVFAIGFDERGTGALVFASPIVLVFGMALASSVGFRRELEEGTLELLLVTPLPPSSIFRARVLTLWRDFFPAAILATSLALIWSLHNATFATGAFGTLITAWSSYLTLPSIGSRIAVRRLSPMVAWLWTLGIALALPHAVASLTEKATRPEYGQPWHAWRYLLPFVVVQFTLAGFCAWITVKDLATRQFRLKPLQRLAQ